MFFRIRFRFGSVALAPVVLVPPWSRVDCIVSLTMWLLQAVHVAYQDRKRIKDVSNNRFVKLEGVGFPVEASSSEQDHGTTV